MILISTIVPQQKNKSNIQQSFVACDKILVHVYNTHMDIKTQLYNELSEFTKNNIKLDNFFVCIYGSYTTEHFGSNSDLDIFIATENYEEKDFLEIRNFIVSLHIDHNLKIDEEVPYKNKLLILYEDIEDAITLAPFIENKTEIKYMVPLIKNDINFLSSKEVRLRLILNALTSSHVFVYGNKEKYEVLKKGCEQAIIRLAYGLSGKNNLKKEDILAILLNGKNGAIGRSHLGYKTERREVIDYLERLIDRNLF